MHFPERTAFPSRVPEQLVALLSSPYDNVDLTPNALRLLGELRATSVRGRVSDVLVLVEICLPLAWRGTFVAIAALPTYPSSGIIHATVSRLRDGHNRRLCPIFFSAYFYRPAWSETVWPTGL